MGTTPFDPPKAHLFVCTNQREVGECCAQKGSLDLCKALKDRSRTDESWKGKVKVSKSGCLGLCSEGIAAVIYPQARWITKIPDATQESTELVARKINQCLKAVN